LSKARFSRQQVAGSILGWLYKFQMVKEGNLLGSCAAFARTYTDVALTGELPTDEISAELRLRARQALREGAANRSA